MTGRRQDAAIVGALPDVIERVSANLRAGTAPLVALAEAAAGADLPEALVIDLDRVVEQAGRHGLEPALVAWTDGRLLPAVGAVAAALQVANDAGGPVSPALDGLAAGLRDQQDAVAEVAALSAQARMSAIVVGAAPVLSLALSVLFDPRVAQTLIGTSPGRTCLIGGIALEGLAAWWMRRIVRCEA